jgi:polyhydroxybutyrate depolymerase
MDARISSRFPRIAALRRRLAEAEGRAADGTDGVTRIPLEHDGRPRFYDLYAPAGLAPDRPAPLVVNLHGGGGNPAQQRRDSGMDAVADAGGFRVAYGAGTSPRGPFLTWNVHQSRTYATLQRIDDVGYIRRVVDDVRSRVAVDARRIYATGFSMGGIVCYTLACTLADTFAAVAPVAAVMQTPPEQRRPGRPVPIIHFHGLRDRNCAFAGGVGPNARDTVPRPGVPESIAWWVRHNGVPDTPVRQGRIGAAEFTQYGEDRDPGTVILWTLHDGGHTWPGGRSTIPEARVGPVNRDIAASERMWEFFTGHPLHDNT